MTDMTEPRPPAGEPATTDTKKPLWQRLLPLVIIAAALGGVFATGADSYLSIDSLQQNQAALKDFAASNLYAAIAVTIAVYALSTAISIPGALVLTLLAGFILGTWAGTFAVVLGATIGATLIFTAARNAAGDSLVKKGGPLMAKMEDGFRENAWSYMLILRLVPLFPFFLVNIAPAAFRVPVWTFVWTTFIGIIPGTAVYASIGAGFSSIADAETLDANVFARPEVYGPVLALIALSLVPIIYKRLSAKDGDRSAGQET